MSRLLWIEREIILFTFFYLTNYRVETDGQVDQVVRVRQVEVETKMKMKAEDKEEKMINIKIKKSKKWISFNLANWKKKIITRLIVSFVKIKKWKTNDIRQIIDYLLLFLLLLVFLLLCEILLCNNTKYLTAYFNVNVDQKYSISPHVLCFFFFYYCKVEKNKL